MLHNDNTTRGIDVHFCPYKLPIEHIAAKIEHEYGRTLLILYC